ncbi:hypothetical protein [Sorangium sp. So ce1078]|uniref:hypothetical protein n=1 Tax=Sorangium sp. So ce1078 TaxID=3133329 RepID=UPI003F5DEF81
MSALRIRSSAVAVVRAGPRRLAGWLLLAASAAAVLLNLNPALDEASRRVFTPDVWGVYGLVLGVACLLNAYFGPDRAPRRSELLAATLEIDADAVTLDRGNQRERVPRHKLEGGYLDVSRDERWAVLRRRGADAVWIRVRDVDEGRALLRAAGLAAEQHVFRTYLVSVAEEILTPGARLAAWLVVTYGAVALCWSGSRGLGSDAHPAVIAAAIGLSCMVVYAVLKLALPRAALVGTDGVALKSFRARRFIPYADIAAVRADGRGVWLEQRGGQPVLLATVPRLSRRLLQSAPPGSRLGAATEVLLARLNEAMAVAERSDASAARFAELDRRGRPIDAWRRALERLAQGAPGAADYRRADVTADDIARMLDDVTALPERRIAAAIALAASDDPALRDRVRIAASACANEALRHALERAAEGELEAADVELAERAHARAAR